MTVLSMEQELADSLVLTDIAHEAGVSTAQAKHIVATLAELPVVQAIRICVAAQSTKARERARQQRRNGR